MLTSKFLDYCTTDRQRKVIAAYIEHGGSDSAAKTLGIDGGNVRKLVRLIKGRAAKAYLPEHADPTQVPDGFAVKGTSTLYDRRDGSTVMQWVKTNQDQERQLELMREAVAALCEDVPRAEPVEGPSSDQGDKLANLHVLTDLHLGCLAWKDETGEDWDLDIAQRLLVRWFQYAIENAPDAQVGILGNIGDFQHWQGFDALTPASKHLLDADTRFPKLVRAAIKSMRTIMDMMLRKYPRVHVIMADANHDPESQVWLREMLAELYADEPRMSVDTSPMSYNCFEWGKVSLFFHHGHHRKPSNVSEVFAALFRDVFGRTKYSYGHMGHLHHAELKENGLMIIEQHRTMAAKDAYAASHGFLSGRSADVITYHKDKGQVWRATVTPEMVS